MEVTEVIEDLGFEIAEPGEKKSKSGKSGLTRREQAELGAAWMLGEFKAGRSVTAAGLFDAIGLAARGLQSAKGCGDVLGHGEMKLHAKGGCYPPCFENVSLIFGGYVPKEERLTVGKQLGFETWVDCAAWVRSLPKLASKPSV